ncbi:predicted protein [Botrytis cinerea T4]|uniref:Uncharacterized protein n=1 Tax=Botryotinia fuckeliana (strain T4) TaxID=999810 RepID=G2YWS1_BOTF4|nr:predicted protein [Botrytis cinerea T4]
MTSTSSAPLITPWHFPYHPLLWRPHLQHLKICHFENRETILKPLKTMPK